MRDLFNHIADRVTRAMGSPFALVTSAAVIVLWAVTGPIFGFSDTWQLAINTGTTIVTFLMVFVIQNSQNRDAKAVHAKLDELIRALDAARNEFVDAEEEPEETARPAAAGAARARSLPAPPGGPHHRGHGLAQRSGRGR